MFCMSGCGDRKGQVTVKRAVVFDAAIFRDSRSLVSAIDHRTYYQVGVILLCKLLESGFWKNLKVQLHPFC